MTYQLTLITEAGMIVRDDTLQLLDGLASVINAQSFILNRCLQDFNTLDVLRRIPSCLRLNIRKQFLRPGLFIE